MDAIYQKLDGKGRVLDTQVASTPARAVSLQFRGYTPAPPVEHKPVEHKSATLNK